MASLCTLRQLQTQQVRKYTKIAKIRTSQENENQSPGVIRKIATAESVLFKTKTHFKIVFLVVLETPKCMNGFGFFGFCSVFWMSGSCVSVDPKAPPGSVRAESTSRSTRESIFWTNYTITRDPVLIRIQ